ncbi:hypothetical protein QBC33DRAFT_562064 [Phialemonium atrogriseum]|uniref:Uncharacterized protein n=1 Tax=Phialemonium atrogriseum TaxID=1093897 RepID=A0AAJ0FEG5_9PEZI|nr:uncharacterized protein QBC33DRAFT_562064 [Phialemonium atrogriseum]KAK1764322.1 hypothetical protein QBC33DRAFT_562064 [Phialemonium atrogriseum]
MNSNTISTSTLPLVVASESPAPRLLEHWADIFASTIRFTPSHAIKSTHAPRAAIIPTDSPIGIESSSPADQGRWRKWLENERREAVEMRTHLEMKKQMALQGSRQQAAASSNRQLGTVLMSSGFDEMTENGYILDWSLIKLNPSRFVHPEMLNNGIIRPSPSLPGPNFQTPDTITSARVNGEPTFHPTAALVENLDDTRPVNVHKVGRTSGTTRGALHELRAATAVTYGIGEHGTVVETEAWVVITSEDTRRAFAWE